MTEIINLNKARKAKAKNARTAKAAENRLVYGLSTKIRKMEKEKNRKEVEKLDQNWLKPDHQDKKG